MNKRLIQFSMKNVAATLIMVVLLFGSGLYAASGLKVENMPDVSIPMVIITTPYPGSPQDVMEQVTKPIEQKIANMDQLQTLTSTSSDNVSTIIVGLNEKADPEQKKTDLESLLQEVKLPESAGRPKVSTIGFASIPSYYMVAYADNGITQSELDQWFEQTFRPSIEAIDGYDHMDAIGARETSLMIRLNIQALAAFGLTPEEVSGGVRAGLSSGPAGSVELDGSSLMARMKGEFNSLYQLQNLELVTRNGNVVRLKEVAKIETVSQSGFIARYNDRPAIGIHLYKMQGANAVEFSGAIDRLVSGWQDEQANVVFQKIFDTADEVKQSISGMLKEGISGALLASLMILLFLRNVRMTLIVLVSIPLSILITMLVMKYLNITLNIMTLGGIFIAIGRVVDDSIVVIENIYSRLQQAHERNESVIKLATQEVASAITSSTLATVGVFAPIGMVSGPAGQLFRPFAITLACAMLASLLVALTVIPLLAKLLVLHSGKQTTHAEHKPGRVLSMYRTILEWSLVHRIKTLMISGAMFLLSLIVIVPFLAVDFLPENGSVRQFFYDIKLPYDHSLKMTDAKVKELEEILHSTKDKNGDRQFTFTESLVGYADSSDPSPYSAQIFTEVSEGSDVNEVKKRVKAHLLTVLPEGSEVEARTLSGDSTSSIFEYALKGNDLQQLAEAAQTVKEQMRQFPELSEIRDTLGDSKMEIEIELEQAKLRNYGMTPAAVQHNVRYWLMKEPIGDLKLDNQLYKTSIELDKENIDTLEKLGRLPLQSVQGETVYLHDIAKLKRVPAPVSIERDNQAQVVKVKAKIEGQNKGGVSNLVAAVLDELELPDGVSREVGGVSSDIDKSFVELFVAMVLAVCIVYLIMVIAFGNASAPFAILFSLPLAVIGGVLGLFVTNESVNITSLIGFMMLIGIVVTNAIVLIDRAQQLREEGYTVRHALIEAGLARFRPIIMTAGATIVALLPLAFGLAQGTLISKGLAIVVIGGLTTSTILTLVVVPVVYELIEAFKHKMTRIFGKKSDRHQDRIRKGAMSG